MTEQIQRVGMPGRPLGPRPPVAAAATITPKDIVSFLLRHVLLIIISTVIGTVSGGLAWFYVQRYYPKYTATTSIEVLPPGEGDPMEFSDAMGNKDLSYQLRTTKAYYIKQQSTFEQLLRNDKIRETNWFKQFDGDLADTIEDLEDNFRASPQRESNYIVVAMTCGGKRESQLIVNEMLNLFLKMQREDATRDIRAQLAEKNSQQRAIKSRLQQQEDALETIRAGTDFVNLGETDSFRDSVSVKLTALEVQRSDLETQMGMFESMIETLRVRAEGEFDEIIREQMERDPIAASMRRQIAGLEVNLAVLEERFGENHRRVRQMRDALKQSKIDYVKRQTEIAEIQRKSALRNAEDQKVALIQQLDTVKRLEMETKREYKELDNLRAKYEQFLTTRDENEELLKDMNVFIEKLNMQYNDPTLSKVRALGPAPEPLRMSSPKKIVYFPGGFMLGLMFGIGLTFAIELLNDLLRTPSDVMKHLHVPLLGMICHEEDDEDIEGVDLCHVVRQAPYSIMSECYRQFRTNLKLTGSGEFQKVLLITSGRAGDGKTSVAINMAATFVAEDKNVLLIDTNFRRPSSATMFPRTELDGSVAEHADFG
ncbi:MAG: hypothetical protein KAR47_07185, partial [Planctomycetes bacterium]|nr:hypothetical protein [Planctomycetota bacterium]